MGVAAMPHSNIVSGTRSRARSLRHNTTEAEKALWRELRRMKGRGFHFRRQTPVGPYVTDFACLSKRLVVEIDGGQHGCDLQKNRDDVRTRWLESQGFRVARFWNHDVLADPQAVAGTLLNLLEAER